MIVIGLKWRGSRKRIDEEGVKLAWKKRPEST